MTAIRRRGEGVRIEHGPGGQALDADYCVCTLPLNLLQRIPERLLAGQAGGDPRHALSAERQGRFESPRFWEEEGIYGGLGWTDQPNENLIYPSGGWHSDKGVLVAAYTAGWTGQNHPQEFTAMSHDERFRVCREVVERMHPGKARLLDKPVTVAWGLTPWSEGVGPVHPDWFANRARRPLCRAAPARRPDLLRRRASELRRLLAGRRGALGAGGDAAAGGPGGGAARRRLIEAFPHLVETAWAAGPRLLFAGHPILRGIFRC